ncbi:MAG: 2-oxoacid:acceptor oxidoreductase family protein [Anaerolineales bacterium]|nr:2-oxoacid:acceptor oxidoreductase family protein [Anaerolineales bacterium]
MKELVFAGFGGQGVLTAGILVSEMALKAGKHVTWMPAYGPSVRGGKAHSVVKFGDDPIGGPAMEEVDTLVAMNKPSLEYIAQVKPGGLVLVNSDAISEEVEIRKDVEVIRVPCLTMAAAVKNPKALNLVMIGAMIGRCDYFTKKAAIEAIEGYFTKKGKSAYNDANVAAFNAGLEFVTG